MNSNPANAQHPLQFMVTINLLVSTLVLIVGLVLLTESGDEVSGGNASGSAQHSVFDEAREQLVSMIDALEQDCPVVLVKSELENVVVYAPECAFSTSGGAASRKEGRSVFGFGNEAMVHNGSSETVRL